MTRQIHDVEEEEKGKWEEFVCKEMCFHAFREVRCENKRVDKLQKQLLSMSADGLYKPWDVVVWSQMDKENKIKMMMLEGISKNHWKGLEAMVEKNEAGRMCGATRWLRSCRCT